MNTHSRWADGRRELFCAHAALAGADRNTARALMDCPTTDGCLEVLDQAGLREAVLSSLLEAIQGHLDRRFGPEGTVGARPVQQSIWPSRPDPQGEGVNR